MKKIYALLCASIIWTNLIFAQHDAKLLKGFDLKAANNEMKLKGIPASDQAGYLNFLKAKYIAANHANVKFDRGITTQAKSYIPVLSPLGFYCPNAGFENFNFNNWTGNTWTLTGFDWTAAPAWTIGVVSSGNNASLTDPNARQTITTIPAGNNNPALGATPGWDSIARNPTTNICEIQTVCPWGNGSSVRLGNCLTGAQTEMLSYTISVSPNNSQFNYSYAVVVQDPNHSAAEQPFFTVTFKDQNGVPLSGCGIYNVNATLAATDPTFIQIPSNTQPNQFDPIYYKKWTLVGVDLSAYNGQNITVEFRAADCSAGGHFGYAYVDADCAAAAAVVNMCAGNAFEQIVAPPGFGTYQWYGPNSNSTPIPANQGGNNDTLTITGGVVGDVYYLTATSVAGCLTYLTATLQFGTVNVISTSSTPSCATGSSGIASVVPSGSPSGNYSFLWTNSSGATVGTSQTASGLAPGTYSVNISAPGCGTYDTTVTVGIAPAYFVGTTQQFCGSASWLLLPSGATTPQWYDNNGVALPSPIGTNDSLLATGVTSSTHYSVVYTNTTGCRDSLVFSFVQTAGGSVYPSHITNVCPGGTNGTASVILNTTNPPTYSYSVTGPNGYTNFVPASTVDSLNLTGLSSGTYNVNVYDGLCFYSQTFVIDTIEIDLNVSAAPTFLCPGDTSHVNFVFGAGAPATCGLSASTCSGTPSLLTVGTNQSQNTNTTYPAVYGNWYSNEKYQILYTAADLNAMGITGGKISSIGFDVASIDPTMNTTFINYSIKMACTSVNDLGTGFGIPFTTASFSQVWGPQTYTINTGINTHNFALPYEWDGVSNLLVEICYDWVGTSTYTYNAIMNNTATTYNSFALFNSDVNVACPEPTFNSSYQERPVTTFGWCPAAALPTDYTYSWSPNTNVTNETPFPNVALTPPVTTQYVLTTTIINGGCIRKDTFDIGVSAGIALVSNAGADINKCAATSVTLQGAASGSTNPTYPYTYAWNLAGNPAVLSTSQNHSPVVAAGNYVLTVDGPCANPVKDTVAITNILNSPTFTISGIDTITLCTETAFGDVLTHVGGTGGISYVWYTLLDTLSNTATLNTTTPAVGPATYTIFASASDSCGYSDQHNLVVNVLPPCSVVIPNIITPNNDGNNDIFVIRNLELHPNSALTIFDRWGKKVFKTDNYQNNWKAAGNHDGTYYYVLEVPNDKSYSGYIQVVDNKN